jgi:hypothetical protein
LGKKKKWQKRGRFYEEQRVVDATQTQIITGWIKQDEPKKVVNPRVLSSNEERRGERNPYMATGEQGGDQPKKSGQKAVIRRKDVHGRVQNQKTGRKRRYGGVKREILQKDMGEQRNLYKKFKSQNERRYRKGKRISNQSLYSLGSSDVQGENRGGRIKQRKQSHRLARTEVRVDRRRYRSGRVPTLQMARDLVEHGHVQYVNEDGTRGPVVKWQGSRVEVGHGRKLNEVVWKNVKERSNRLLQHDEYAMTALGYMEVDYVAGMRVLLRKPGSNEVVIPKGMDLSMALRERTRMAK